MIGVVAKKKIGMIIVITMLRRCFRNFCDCSGVRGTSGWRSTAFRIRANISRNFTLKGYSRIGLGLSGHSAFPIGNLLLDPRSLAPCHKSLSATVNHPRRAASYNLCARAIQGDRTPLRWPIWICYSCHYWAR